MITYNLKKEYVRLFFKNNTLIDYILGGLNTLNKQMIVSSLTSFNCFPSFSRSSRKALLLITIFAIHSHFLLPSFFQEGREKGKIIIKVVVKSYAFCSIPFITFLILNTSKISIIYKEQNHSKTKRSKCHILAITLEKIRYRIIIPEFYVLQICKHGQSVVIGQRVKF